MEVNFSVLGAPRVGKSSITIMYTQNYFVEDQIVDFGDSYRKQVCMDSTAMLLNIHDFYEEEDSALTEAFKRSALRSGSAVLLVYAINDRGSFEEVEQIYNQAVITSEVEKLPVVLVGNKSDLKHERQVSKEEGANLAKYVLNCPFFEISAKNYNEVQHAVGELVRISKEWTKYGMGGEKKKKRGGIVGWISDMVDPYKEIALEALSHVFVGGRLDVLKVIRDPGSEQHKSDVFCLDLFQGKILASGSRDGVVKLWDSVSADHFHTLTGHKEIIQQVKFIDGKLFSSSNDETVIEWNLTATPPSKFRTYVGHGGPVLCLYNNPEYQDTLFSAGRDGAVIMWNTTTSKDKVVFVDESNDSDILCMCTMGDFLFTGSSNGQLRVWNIPLLRLCGQIGREEGGHTSVITQLLVVKERAMLISASADSTIRLWRVSDRFHCFKVLRGHTDWVNTLCLREDVVYSGSSDGSVIAWSLQDEKPIRVFKADTSVLQVGVYRNNSVIAALKSGEVRLFSIGTGKCEYMNEGHGSQVNALVVDQNAGIAYTAGNDNIVRSWDMKDYRLLNIFGSKKNKFQKKTMPQLMPFISLLVVLVNAMQLLAFSYGGEVPWKFPYVMEELSNPLGAVLPLMRFSLLQLDTSFSPYIFGVRYLFSIQFILSFLVNYVLSKTFHNLSYRYFVFKAAYALDWLTCWLFSGILFIPVLTSLLEVLECPWTVDMDNPSFFNEISFVQCWYPVHALLIMISVAMIMVVLIPILRLVGVGGDLRAMALHYRVRWKYDKPNTKMSHAFSKRSLSLDKYLRLLEFLLCLISVIPFVWVSLPLQSIVFLFLLVFSVVFPPYYSAAVSALLISLRSVALLTSLFAIALISLPQHNEVITVLHAIVAPSSLILVFVVSKFVLGAIEEWLKRVSQRQLIWKVLSESKSGSSREEKEMSDVCKGVSLSRDFEDYVEGVSKKKEINSVQKRRKFPPSFNSGVINEYGKVGILSSQDDDFKTLSYDGVHDLGYISVPLSRSVANDGSVYKLEMDIEVSEFPEAEEEVRTLKMAVCFLDHWNVYGFNERPGTFAGSLALNFEDATIVEHTSTPFPQAEDLFLGGENSLRVTMLWDQIDEVISFGINGKTPMESFTGIGNDFLIPAVTFHGANWGCKVTILSE